MRKETRPDQVPEHILTREGKEILDDMAMDGMNRALISKHFSADQFTFDAFVAVVNKEWLDKRGEWPTDEEEALIQKSFFRLADPSNSGFLGRDDKYFFIKNSA